MRCLYLTLTLLTAGSSPLFAQAPAPDQQNLIKISKATTHITKPLDKQGFADYTAYLNQIHSEGVTSENNSVILYWKAIGPDSGETTPEFRARLVEILGVDVFAEPGPHLVNIGQFAQLKIDLGVVPNNQMIFDQQGKTSEGPWTADKYPMMAEWVEMNEKPLQLVTEGSRREKYYSPVVTINEGDPLIATLLPNVQMYRSFARLLQARAMLALGEGRVEDARQDLLTMHRLARHTAQGPTLIEMLVGVAIDAIAYQGDRQIALHGNMTSKELIAWRKELAKLGPVSSFRDAIDTGERFFGLDSVQNFAKAALSNDEEMIQFISSLGFDGNGSFLTSLILKFSIDWNVVMTRMNEHYDAMVAAASLPTHNQRITAFEKLEQKLKELTKDMTSGGNIAKFVFLGAETRGQQMGNILLALLAPAVQQAQEAENRSNAKLAAQQAGLAILAFRADTGELPGQLSDLVPKYLDAVPTDLYTEKPLTYRTQGTEFAVYSLGQNQADNHGKTWGDEGVSNDNHDHVFRSEGWVVK
ncbi:MAG TPA: hypothetical protein VLA12_01130 [Planctomycetaceae bacterium]|nr:hypothetical protein [Planctomycetaceae bacterium]